MTKLTGSSRSIVMPERQEKEFIGAGFNLMLMREARELTWRAIEAVAGKIVPGMSESDAGEVCRLVVSEAGLLAAWHPPIVRFGVNTLKSFREKSDPDVILQENDIFFLDVGPVWKDHEADAGATFVVGDDEEMLDCARASRLVYDQVAEIWRELKKTGPELYGEAQRLAGEAGFVLNLDIAGHRIGDFPHQARSAGRLGDASFTPSPGLWVLEIQLRHPTRPFGSFFEDLLLEPDQLDTDCRKSPLPGEPRE